MAGIRICLFINLRSMTLFSFLYAFLRSKPPPQLRHRKKKNSNFPAHNALRDTGMCVCLSTIATVAATMRKHKHNNTGGKKNTEWYLVSFGTFLNSFSHAKWRCRPRNIFNLLGWGELRKGRLICPCEARNAPKYLLRSKLMSLAPA